MSIFRQILQLAKEILAEIRGQREELEEIEAGIQELLKNEQPVEPSEMSLTFSPPTNQ